MSVTNDACRKVATQLARASRNASVGGDERAVTVREPAYLIRVLRRAARELDRSA